MKMKNKYHFNFNDTVKFKPTVLAAEVLLREHEDFWEAHIDAADSLDKIGIYEMFQVGYYMPSLDENGYMSLPLWDFMKKFGPELNPGINLEDYFLDYYLETN